MINSLFSPASSCGLFFWKTKRFSFERRYFSADASAKAKARQNLNAKYTSMRALSSPLLSLSSSSSSSRKNDRATAKTGRSSSSPRSFLQSPSRVTVLRRTNSTRTSSSSFSVKASSSSNEENKEIQVTLVDCFTSDVGKMTSETRKNAEESIMELENARFVSEKYLFANAKAYIFFLFFERERKMWIPGGISWSSSCFCRLFICLLSSRVLASFSRVSYSARSLFARYD